MSPNTFSERAGFTLLEVLLTSVLASVVLVALWSLSDIYLRMFASGKRKVDETQIVRGLTGQLAKDLSEVIQLADDVTEAAPRSREISSITPVQNNVPNRPISPNLVARTQYLPDPLVPRKQIEPDTGASIMPSPSNVEAGKKEQFGPRFGLFGTKQALRLIVLQTDPRTTRPLTELSEILPQPGEARTPLATELRTIQYTFAVPHESTLNDRQHPGGLVRREWAWESWTGLKMASLPPTGAGSSISGRLPESPPEWTEEDAIALLAERDVVHVPQVVGLEFRYFDGETWDFEWDSWERRRLPLLVEFLLKVKTTKDEHDTGTSHELPNEVDVPQSLADENSNSGSTNATSGSGSVYRKLIYLPFADAKLDSNVADPDGPIAEMADSKKATPQFRTRQP